MNICQIDKNCIHEINTVSKRVSIFPCNPNSDDFKQMKEIVRIVLIGIALIVLMKIMFKTTVPIMQNEVKTILKNK